MTLKRREVFEGLAALGLAGFVPGSRAFAENGAPPEPRPGERLLLDDGWRFYRGDIVLRKPRGDAETYASTKAGAAGGAAGRTFDDSAWRTLDLPHDFVVEGPFEQDANTAQGYRPKGVAWYRRTLHLDPADRGKYLELQFDGIATNATIWFNGNVVAHVWSAYDSAYIDITPFARERAGDRLADAVAGGHEGRAAAYEIKIHGRDATRAQAPR